MSLLHSKTPDTGDTLHVSGVSYIARRIKWYQRRRGETKTKAHHCEAFYTADELQGAHNEGVIRHPWEEYKAYLEDHNCEWCIMTRKWGITDRERIDLKRAMDNMLGWKYSFPEIFLQKLDCWLGKIFGVDMVVFRRLGDIVYKWVICSTFVCMAYIAVQWLKSHCRFWNPDDLCDYQEKSPQWAVRDCSAKWFRKG